MTLTVGAIAARGAEGALAKSARHSRFALLVPLVCGLAACSSGSDRDDPDSWYNKTVMENIVGRAPEPAPPGYAGPGPGTPLVASSGRIMAAPESELYRSEGSCGGIVLGTAPAFSGPGSAISLEMTECDVARRAGPPDRMELAGNERGERFLTLTYARGDRPRLYRFASGRLVAIEALAPAVPVRASKSGRSTAPGRN